MKKVNFISNKGTCVALLKIGVWVVIYIRKKSGLQYVLNITCSCHTVTNKQKTWSAIVNYGTPNLSPNSSVYVPLNNNSICHFAILPHSAAVLCPVKKMLPKNQCHWIYFTCLVYQKPYWNAATFTFGLDDVLLCDVECLHENLGRVLKRTLNDSYRIIRKKIFV